MRCVGRQCRGPGRIFVTWVRHTERQLLALGQPIHALGQQAQQLLAQANEINAAQRAGLAMQLTTALGAHGHIRQQSGRLTQGKKLRHCKLVKAYEPTIAPIMKGTSHCPKAGDCLGTGHRLYLCQPRTVGQPERSQRCVARA